MQKKLARILALGLLLWLALPISAQGAQTTRKKPPVVIQKKAIKPPSVNKKNIRQPVKKIKPAVKPPVKKITAPIAVAQPKLVQVSINGRPLGEAKKQELEKTYSAALPEGNYWYDAMSGAYGRTGEGMITFINPGHDLGTMPRDASDGQTRVLINGRELPSAEVAFYTAIVGAVSPGSYWLDGRTGNFGIAGNSAPLVNLLAAIKRQGGAFQRNSYTDATSGSQGGCSYVNFGDGSGVSVGC